jgi:hypothetical protein
VSASTVDARIVRGFVPYGDAQEYRWSARCSVSYRHRRSRLVIPIRRATHDGSRAGVPAAAVVDHDERFSDLPMLCVNCGLRAAVCVLCSLLVQRRSFYLKEAFT